MSAWLAPTLFALASGLGVNARAWRPPELTVDTSTRAASFAQVRSNAFKYLGRPYRMGGTGKPTFDCSGFTCRVFAESGYAIPRVSRDQAKAGLPVSIDRIQAGDLLFFTSQPDSTRITHVGLYLGDRQMIHAASGSGRVLVDSIDRRYYRQRLKRARRILELPQEIAGPVRPGEARPKTKPKPRSKPKPAKPSWVTSEPTAVEELVEHTGGSELPIMLRLPPKRARPSAGPQLPGAGVSSIALRAELLTEDGILGVTLVPEGTLYLEDYAFEIAVAVPIRFELNETPTVGELETFGDWLRFIRTLSLGLPGADLELRFARLGDFTVGDGVLIDRAVPASEASGVPALSVGRTPLSFFGAYRGGPVNGALLIDDVGDPALIGGSVDVPLLDGLLTPAISVVTDQHGGSTIARRAVTAAAASVTARVFEDEAWTIEAGGHAAGLVARGEVGAGGGAHLSFQHRFGGGNAFDGRLDLMGLGANYLARPFGPTYLAARPEHVVALAGAPTRFGLGGEVHLRFGKLAFGAAYHDAVNGHLLDRRLEASAELLDIELGSGRVLDVRAAYAARGVPGDRHAGAHDTLHASARLRFTPWLWTELYVEKGDTWEGGGGVAVGWAP